jgi:hypothetical protein
MATSSSLVHWKPCMLCSRRVCYRHSISCYQFQSDADICFSPLQRINVTRKHRYAVYGARFSTELYTRRCHWFPCLLASSEHACDQCHSSRAFTFLLPVHTVNCVQTRKAGTGQDSNLELCYHTDGVTQHERLEQGKTLTLNSVTTLMASHNTKGCWHFPA